MNSPMFAPSLMCMDITNTCEVIETLSRHCHLLHVDIMDGHFVKNITLSAGFIEAIAPLTPLPVDAHLMVTNPDDYISSLAKAGAEYITVHAETIGTNAFRTLRQIHDTGCKAGVCICPATPPEALRAYLDEIDLLTVMTVDPGYAGQQFIPQMVEKVKTLAQWRKENKLSFVIQCDGAIGAETYQPLYDAGARAFVMGTSGLFFAGATLEENCLRMKAEFENATGVKTWAHAM